MYTLGMLYEDGREVEQDLEKSKYWYEKASKLDD